MNSILHVTVLTNFNFQIVELTKGRSRPNPVWKKKVLLDAFLEFIRYYLSPGGDYTTSSFTTQNSKLWNSRLLHFSANIFMVYKVLDLEQSNCIYFFFIYQVYSVNYFNIYCEHKSLFLSLQASPLTVARSLLPPMHYNFPTYIGKNLY